MSGAVRTVEPPTNGHRLQVKKWGSIRWRIYDMAPGAVLDFKLTDYNTVTGTVHRLNRLYAGSRKYATRRLSDAVRVMREGGI